MPKRRRLVAAAALGALALASALVVSLLTVGGQESPSTAKRIPGPSVGPAGQTGPITYLENPATPFTGEAKSFGPFRLLPPGTKYIDRDGGFSPSPGDITSSNDIATVRASPLYVAPVPDAQEIELTEERLKGDPFRFTATWATGGKSIHLARVRYPDNQLPIDIYLHFPDSRVQVRPEMIAGKYAIVTEPASGPAANVGDVAIWLDGSLLWLWSPHADHTELRNIAAQLAATTR